MNTISITNNYTRQIIIEEEVHETNEIEVGGLYYTQSGIKVAFLQYVPNVGFLVTDVTGSNWDKVSKPYNFEKRQYEDKEQLKSQYCGTDKTGLRFVRTLFADSNCKKLIATFKIHKNPIKVYKKKNKKED